MGIGFAIIIPICLGTITATRSRESTADAEEFAEDRLVGKVVRKTHQEKVQTYANEKIDVTA